MPRRIISLLLFVFSCVFCATARSEETPKADKSDERYTYREEHDLNGIGKFYFNREIAHVMGHQGIEWLERPQREEEEKLTLLVESLGLEPGMVVADIGAG